ncbi:ER membrane protein complex subunit 1 [Smittium mucronatum]|uniref:ER membrane protein complex subunit 1 n=1 Tax=Smittium mucronatum TaxID=133383 RepID=A0A1R0GNW4_9FUNG|nr:ER membrane protein complex subunit 1 [Smittium mucronatum]
MNLLSGILDWRQHLDNDEILFFELYQEGIFTISGSNSQKFQLWDTKSGNIIWENVNNQPIGKHADAFLEKDQKNLVATTAGKAIVQDESLFVIGDIKTPSKQLQVSQLNLNDGSVVKNKKIAPNQSLSSLNLAFLHSHNTKGFIVWRDRNNIVWFIHKLGVDQPEFSIFHPKLFHEELNPQDMMGSVILTLNTKNMEPKAGLLYKSGNKSRIVIVDLIDKDGEPFFEKSFEFESNDPSFGRSRLNLSPNGYLSTMLVTPSNKIKYTIFDLSAKGKKIYGGQSTFGDSQSDYGYLQSIYLTGNSKDSYKIVFQSVDGLACAINPSPLSNSPIEQVPSSPIWCRDEVLTSTTDQTFLDLNLAEFNGEKKPFDESSNQESSNILFATAMNYFNRLHNHLLEIKSAFNNLISSASKNDQTGVLKVNEIFGFGKLTIFVSRYGRVTALDALTGNLVWSVQINNVLTESSDSGSVKPTSYLKTFKLFITKSFATPSSPPLVVVAGRNSKNNTVLITINGLDGKIIKDQSKDIGYRALKIVESNIIDKETDQKILLIAKMNSEKKDGEESESLTVGCWPRSESAALALSNFDEKLFVVLGDKLESDSLRGYKLNKFEQKAEGNQFESTGDLLWNMNFLSDNMQIIDVAHPGTDLRVSSVGSVLDNRKILYKYLNPNAMIVMLRNKDQKTGLRVIIMDRVSGRVLGSFDHKNAVVDDLENRKPLIAMQDNWAAYYFWDQSASIKKSNNKFDRKGAYGDYNLVSLELFESNIADDKVSKAEFSSFDSLKPHIYSETFILKNSLSSLGIASSQNGITSQSLILGYKLMPLSTVPHQQINPRRRKSSDPKDVVQKSDYLVEYEPVIMAPPENFLSYSLELIGTNRVKSSPTRLESTVIVLSYGIDVFCTRVTPSGNFDVLSSQFSKINLVLTMLVLFIAGALSFPFVKRRGIADLWK